MNRDMAIQSLRMRRNVMRSRIGGPLWHTVGDRFDMVKMMNTSLVQVHNEAMQQMGYTRDNPSAVEKDSRWEWYRAVVIPFIAEWDAFKDRLLGSGWVQFTTNWDTIELWMTRMLGMRAAIERKFTIQSPEPTRLTQTMWQDAGQKLSDIGAGAAGTLKTLLYAAVFGALAIGLIFVLKGAGKTTALVIPGKG